MVFRCPPSRLLLYGTLLVLCLDAVVGLDASHPRLVKEVTEGGGTEDLGHRTAIYVILIVLVAISVCFEVGKEKLEERTSEAMKPIVRAFYGEFMIGGLISLISFALVKSDALQGVSRRLFEEDEVIPELVEDIHVMLFIVFALFMCEVLILIRIASRLEQGWRAAEVACKDPAAVLQEYLAIAPLKKSGAIGFFDFAGKRRYRTARMHMEYLNMRKRFIQPIEPGQPNLPQDFDFAEYLSLNMGESIAEMVEITPLVWIIILIVFFLLIWCIQAFPENVQIGLYTLFGWKLYLVGFSLRRKLKKIRRMLLCPLPTVVTVDAGVAGVGFGGHPPASESSPLLDSVGSIQGEDGDEEEVLSHKPTAVAHAEQLVLYEEESIPPYREAVSHTARSWLGRMVLGRLPSKHESLFPFDRKGPGFMLTTLSTVAFLASVYVALYSFFCTRYVWHHIPTVPARIVMWIIGYAPIVLLTGFFMPPIMSLHTLVSHVEQMKDPKMVKRTLTIVRARKTMRTIKLLQSVKNHTRRFKKRKQRDAVSEGDDDVAISKKESGRERGVNARMTAAQEREIRELFALFDDSGDGKVSTSELSAFMKSLGHDITHAEAADIIAEVDVDGDGHLDCDEFVFYMNSQAEVEDEDEEETLRDMFNLFDQSGTGSITLDDFVETLSLLGNPLSRHEAEDIIRELDENGDGEIDMEEFEAMIKKFAE